MILAHAFAARVLAIMSIPTSPSGAGVQQAGAGRTAGGQGSSPWLRIGRFDVRWRHAREGSAAVGGQGRGRRRRLTREEEKRCECGWPMAALAAGDSTRWARGSRWISRRDDAQSAERAQRNRRARRDEIL